jgi:hypothetical protein
MPSKKSENTTKKNPISQPFFQNLTQKQQPELLENRSKSRNQENFFERMVNFFWSDYLWVFISFTSLLVSILFYFQFLQPQIISTYIRFEQDLIDRSVLDFQNKAQLVSAKKQEIIGKTQPISNSGCDEKSKYTTEKEDLASLESLNEISSTLGSYTSAPKLYIFTDKDVTAVHEEFFKEYTTELDLLEEEKTTLKQYIDLANYRNSWIDFCIGTRESQSQTKKLEEFCGSMQRKNSLLAPQLISKTNFANLKPIIDDLNKTCSSIATTTLGTFAGTNKLILDSISWVETISKPNLSGLDSIEKKNENMANIASKSKEKLSILQKRKTDFNGLWYLIGIDLR